jgi:O-antigen ligase
MGIATPVHPSGRTLETRGLSLGALLALGVLLGVGVAAAFHRTSPPLALLIVGVAGLFVALALTLVRYDVAVATGFVLLTVVKFEPAPPDAVFAVVIAVALVTGRFELSRVPLVVIALVGSFLFLNVVSAVDVLDPARAAAFFSITLYLCVFALWFTGYLRSVRRAHIVVVAYVAGAVASAALGTLSLTTGVASGALTAYDATRASGLFKDPNVFGPFLVPAALILLEETLRPRLLRRRPFVHRLLFLILVVGVLFSYSRGAWLNLVVGTVVMLVVLALRRRSGGGALGMLVIIVLAGSAVAGTVAFTESAALVQERAQRQTYDTDRFGAQRRGVELGAEHPVGIGPGQFEIRSPLSTHSTYVRVLAEQGVLGFVSLVGLFFATLIFALRNAGLGRDTFGVGSAALLGAWCGILVNSLVVDTLHWRHLWFVAAMIWVAAAARSLRGGRSAAPG